MQILERKELPRLVEALRAEGRTLIGPTIRDHAIIDDEIESVGDLPVGWTDEQAPGRYRLKRRDDERAFGYVVGPEGPKRRLFPAREALYQAERRVDGKVGFRPVKPEPSEEAWLGVRACELAAMEITDRVFAGGPNVEPRYAARRAAPIVVAVSCTEPGELCFCTSTGSGPRAGEGADVVLTERDDDFVVEAITERGKQIVESLPTRAGTGEDERWVGDAIESAEQRMGRTVDTKGLPELLAGNLDHPRWDDVAERCLACGNCTSVCPTCFCSTIETPSTLDGSETTTERLWESCFSSEHAEIHGGSFRPEIKHRYRQWLTHKVGGWVSQLGSSGCVGCGRCIAWCPVGIDITEEIAAIRADAEPATPIPPHIEPTAADEEDLVPHVAVVSAIEQRSPDVFTIRAKAEDIDVPLPGQFSQLSVAGFGEVPISVSGVVDGELEHTIRSVGAVTKALCSVQPGDVLGIRGPYGQPWPLDEAKGRPVVFVAGGIGLAPLRLALLQALSRPHDYPSVHLFFGTRTPQDVVFAEELVELERTAGLRLHVTVDRADKDWDGHVGVVTRLLRHGAVPKDATAFMCGPEVMMRFTADGLRTLGLADDRIYLTLERHMKCGTGFCGRCQLGPFLLCRDGPVFRYDIVSSLFGRHGI